MQLTEKYRPATLSEVIGQSATIESLNMLLTRGLHSSAFYFVGPSGTGKTTIGKVLINALQIGRDDTFEIAGADVTAEMIRELRDKFSLSTWGESGWKACIIDEAHGMSKQAVQLLLPYLEKLPAKRLFVFTSTEKLDGDMFGNFTSPLASRCKVYELSIDLDAFAEHAAGIASDEGLNGRPLDEYKNLLTSCRGNLRAALQQIETGRMLKPFEAVPVPLVASKPVRIAKPDAQQSKVDAKPIKAPSTDKDAEIAKELVFGAKFLKGTKNPKYFKHLERLEALRAR